MTDATKESTGGHEKEFKLVKDEERILEVRLECKGFSSWTVPYQCWKGRAFSSHRWAWEKAPRRPESSLQSSIRLNVAAGPG